MQTRILDRHDLAAILAERGIDQLMDKLIHQIETEITSFDAEITLSQPRDGFQYQVPLPGLIEWMPVLRAGDSVAIKIVGYHPNNPKQNQLPTIIGTIGLFSAANGCLTGLVDGSLPTTMRTAAASAVATRKLAKHGSSTLGIIGAGAQGLAQCHAITRDFPIEQVQVYDIDPTNQSSFASRLKGLLPDSIEVQQMPLDEVISGADILCTATSIAVGEGPLFSTDVETKPWLHINAVGSDFPGKFELPVGLLKRALVCPDFTVQCFKEGECQQLEQSEVGPDIVELCKKPVEDYRQLLTVFDSTGWALEDQVVCEMFLEEAESLGVGSLIDFHHLSQDPLNPYAHDQATDQQPALSQSRIKQSN